MLYPSIPLHQDVHLDQTHQAFREFRQVSALGKTKVIQVQIIAWNDDGEGMGIFIEVPFVEVDVYEFVRDGFEKHFRRKVYSCFLHSQTGGYFKLRRGESAYCSGE